MKIYDVIIVGGGPSGVSTAMFLLKHRPDMKDKILLLEKGTFPREKPCGGGLTKRTMAIYKELGVDVLKDGPKTFPVESEVLICDDNVGRKESAFLVAHRYELDKWFSDKAVERGLKIEQGTIVKDVKIDDKTVTVSTNKGDFFSKIIVGADGVHSLVRKKVFGDMEDYTHIIKAMEIKTPEDEANQSEFKKRESIFDFGVIRDGVVGYYWDFPSYVGGKPKMNRGIGESLFVKRKKNKPLNVIFDEELTKRGINLKDHKLEAWVLRGFHEKTFMNKNRCLLVGDSAGIDPLLGEGIGFALGYGKTAAEEILKALDSNSFDFKDYKKNFLSSEIGQNLRKKTRMARVLSKYPNLVKHVFKFHFIASMFYKFGKKFF